MESERLELIDPLLPPMEGVLADVRHVLESKWFTNGGPVVRELEALIADAESVPHAIAVGSGTLGLIVALKALGRAGEVVIPAFTFPATAHAVVAAGLEPVIADVDPETFTLDPASTARMCGPRTAAIMPVTCFGVPADLDAIAAAAPGVPIVVDNAQGFGSKRAGDTIPAASVLSLHATKTVMAGEGGVVMTHDADLATRIRGLVNFGFVPGGDCATVGTNGKMPELSAVLAKHSLVLAEATIAARCAWAERYRVMLDATPGISFQTIPGDVTWNGQFFTVLVDEAKLGRSRDQVRDALDADGIVTRRYFHPPVHQLKCYGGRLRQDDVPVSERLSRQALCLPSRAASPLTQVDRIAGVINALSGTPAST